MEKAIAIANGRNNEPGIPVMVKAGAKTARIQSRISNFGKAISLQASQMARAFGFPSRKVLVNIFNRNRGFIHQYTDRKRQTAQRHDIDGLTKQIQKQYSGNNGCRYSQDNNQAPRAVSQGITIPSVPSE